MRLRQGAEVPPGPKNHKHASSPMLWVGVDGPLHGNAVYLMFRIHNLHPLAWPS